LCADEDRNIIEAWWQETEIPKISYRAEMDNDDVQNLNSLIQRSFSQISTGIDFAKDR
jgi:hypothetical protein